MTHPPGNALVHSTSPYLRQHADNPVAWEEWGEAAFARAREQDKPVFLSIGYSTCHWCHVMAAESFADAGIAELLNAHFVAIKVDREQRPDVDQVYMTFVQATTGSGGWPLTLWLTPDREPLVGATYLPRNRLAAALEDVARAWREDRDGLCHQATALSQRIAESLAAPAAADPSPPERSLLTAAEDALAADYDAAHGGFGGAPKFPRPSELEFLFAIAGSDRACRAAEMACATLAAIVHGGIHDHLGGGFHRYSVDACWQLPHFEKMLYDQGQLLSALCAAHRLRPDPLWDEAIRATVTYVRTRLRHADGAFFAAEDADAPTASGAHREGAYYLWSQAELQQLLGDDTTAFCLRYGVEADGNIAPAQDPHGELRGLNVLHHAREPAAVAAELGLDPAVVLARLGIAEARCEQARRERPPPHRDEKIITAWNGLMISGLVDAAMLLDEEGWLADARRAAAFIDTQLRDGERLWRSWSDGRTTARGVASDYAALARARLDLFVATGNPADLETALALLRGLDTACTDPTTGGWFESDHEASDVLWRIRERHDGAEPAAASIAVDTLIRLHRITGDPMLGERARQVLQSHGAELAASPRALPAFARALARTLSDPGEVVIVGSPRDPRTRALLKTAWAPPPERPEIVPFHPGTAERLRAGHPERDGLDPAGDPEARLCRGHTCLAPTGDPEHLRELLTQAH